MSRAQPADQHDVNGNTHGDPARSSSEDPDSDSASTTSSDITSSSGSDSEEGPQDHLDVSQERTGDGTVRQAHDSTTHPRSGESVPAGDLRTRLALFLPQLADANRGLSRDAAEQIDVVGEDEEHYVEMNLGLGVLEEQHAGGKDDIVVPRGEPDDSSDSEDGQDDVVDGSAMAALKGETVGPKKRGIEEVE